MRWVKIIGAAALLWVGMAAEQAHAASPAVNVPPSTVVTAEEPQRCNNRLNQICRSEWQRNLSQCDTQMRNCGQGQGGNCARRQDCQVKAAQCYQTAANDYLYCLNKAGRERDEER